MKKVLLEGTELSGKTTLVSELERLSKLERIALKTNKGSINRYDPFLQRVYDWAEKVSPGNVREILYTAGLIFDKDPNEIYGNDFDFFVQERSFPSIIAYSKVFHPFGFSNHLGKLFLPLYPKFDYNLLITCSNSERERRLKQRTYATELDRKIEGKIELAELLEFEMRKLLTLQKNYQEINTDETTPQEIARYILEL